MKSEIKALMIGTAATFLMVACSAPDQPPTDVATIDDDDELVEYLFVQHAQQVSLENNVLTLEGVGDDVLYFSDRPDRIVGYETLEEFIDDWDEGEESFATIPPNAIVTVVRGGESFDLAAVLMEPTMVGDNSMTYNVEILDGPDSGVGEDAALFIDAFGKKPGGESRLGRPGKPGDPGGLRDADVDDLKVKGKRGRKGDRKFKNKKGKKVNKEDLDRKL